MRIIRTRNILLLYEHYILYYSLFVSSNFVEKGGRERRTTMNDCKYEKASKEDRTVYLFKSFISWPVVVRRVCAGFCTAIQISKNHCQCWEVHREKKNFHNFLGLTKISRIILNFIVSFKDLLVCWIYLVQPPGPARTQVCAIEQRPGVMLASHS